MGVVHYTKIEGGWLCNNLKGGAYMEHTQWLFIDYHYVKNYRQSQIAMMTL